LHGHGEALALSCGDGIAERQRRGDGLDDLETLARQYGVTYIDITPGSRLAAGDSSLLAPDGLHYSAKEYARWADLLAGIILPVIQREKP